MTSFLNRSVLLISLAHLTIELCNNFLPVLYPILINTLQLSYTQIGAIALVMRLGLSKFQPFSNFFHTLFILFWVMVYAVKKQF